MINAKPIINTNKQNKKATYTFVNNVEKNLSELTINFVTTNVIKPIWLPIKIKHITIKEKK